VYYLAEDPWYLAGALAIVALGMLIALKTTQQGKFLIWALVCLGMAGVTIVVEKLWVTDSERIEAVIMEIGRAARRSDADGVIALMTPDVVLEIRGNRLGGMLARPFVRGSLEQAKFDFLTISKIEISSGSQTRRGTANFRVHAGGSYGSFNFMTGASGSDWSMGLQRSSDGEWKVNRVTATRLPWNVKVPAGGGEIIVE
jgi:hypothetical protein